MLVEVIESWWELVEVGVTDIMSERSTGSWGKLMVVGRSWLKLVEVGGSF
jgi:hypothetical protein